MVGMTEQYLQWPFFDSSHRELVAELDQWCRANLTKAGQSGHDREVRSRCRDLVRDMADGGWFRYLVTREYGGIHERVDLRSVCLIREVLASYSGLSDFVFAMQGLGSCAILLHGTDEQKYAYLPDVVAGNKIAAFAMTEISSGSDVAAMQTRAESTGEGYVINGTKTFISNGGIADYYIVFARTGEAPGAKGLSALIVDADSSGLDDSEEIHTMAPHPLSVLRFNQCHVPSEALIGESGSGFRYGMAVLDMFRATVASAALGFSRRALHEATGRALSRELFGATLASHPVTQSRLAEMAVDVDASALLIYRAAWEFDALGTSTTRSSSMAKLFSTERAQRVVDKAVQMFGGMGVVSGVVVEELYREVRALRIYEGASEVQKLVIARKHLGEFQQAPEDPV